MFRNAVVLRAIRDGLDVARKAIRDYMGREEVRLILKGQDSIHCARSDAHGNRPCAQEHRHVIQQAYALVVTVSDKMTSRR